MKRWCSVEVKGAAIQRVSPKACRVMLREQRKQLLPDVVKKASLLVSEKIMASADFLNSNHIAYYLPHENEIDLSQVFIHALALKKSVYLPVFYAPHDLKFYRVDKNTPYQKNKLGILEPVSNDLISVDQLDLMVIPLVAFDACCHRLGRGLGCYDRYLQAAHHCKRIGVAYEFQKILEIQPEAWDVPMDYIVTERADYKTER
ncbi:MAG: 5-formyltetrahydrofolate cyclo-ligase [Coxiellaceae bacterium]|nr:5-formyltetrahydrofolate cyclo-ligase [Coxiellaceae bacterium]